MSQKKRRRGELHVPFISKGSLESLVSLPITAFIGYNGSGKTLAAVTVAMAHLDAGRPVLSTVRLLDWRDPRECDDPLCESERHGEPGHMAAHPLYRPFTDFRQMFDLTGGHILMDEVTGVADAREFASMPVQVRNHLPQLRRRDVTLGWTTIHWSFADARLRRMTWAACWATGMLPHYDPDAMWGRNRLFLHRIYDSRNLPDEFDVANHDDSIRPRFRTVMWGPNTEAFGAYDSNDAVSALGAATEAGMCLTCGGRRSMPRCSCVHDHDAEESPVPARTEKRPRRASRGPAAVTPRGATDDDTTPVLPAPSSPLLGSGVA